MSTEYRSALMLGWKIDSSEINLVDTTAYDEMRECLEEIDCYFEDDFECLMIGKTISHVGFNDNPKTLYWDSASRRECEEMAYNEIEKFKEYWRPSMGPEILHFVYAV